MQPAARLLALLLLVVALPGAALAQRTRLEIAVPPRGELTTTGPLVRAINVLDDSRTRDFLRNGFPVRLHYRVERWSTGGFFNDLESDTEWDVIVRFDGLTRTYQVARLEPAGPVPVGRFPDLESTNAALERPMRVPLVAARDRDRQYYVATLEVETLSLNDLDEVERWLRGELKPAVRGERNPGTALTRGVRTLVVKLLGGEKRTIEVRSGTFRV